MFSRLLEDNAFVKKIRCIIYDEAHFIVTSGQPDKEGNVFRPEYAKGYELRLRLPLKIPCAIFSATMSQTVMNQILKSLRIPANDPNTRYISLSTNRKNLTYAVRPILGSYTDLANFDFLVPLPVHPPLTLPKKTLIFVSNKDLALRLEPYLSRRLPKGAVSRIYSSFTAEYKEQVIKSFLDPSGPMLVLITTDVSSNVRLNTLQTC